MYEIAAARNGMVQGFVVSDHCNNVMVASLLNLVTFLKKHSRNMTKFVLARHRMC